MTSEIMDTQAKHDNGWKYARTAMAWYGWGSPVGAGLFLVAAAATAALLRYAFVG